MFYCVVPENIHTPMVFTFALDPPHPLEFPLYTVGGACDSPPAPGICVNFQLVWGPSGKYICVKNIIVALYYCLQKIISTTFLA